MLATARSIPQILKSKHNPAKPFDNFSKSVENLLKTGEAKHTSNPSFQSMQGVVSRDAPYLSPRHAATHLAMRRGTY